VNLTLSFPVEIFGKDTIKHVRKSGRTGVHVYVLKHFYVFTLDLLISSIKIMKIFIRTTIFNRTFINIYKCTGNKIQHLNINRGTIFPRHFLYEIIHILWNSERKPVQIITNTHDVTINYFIKKHKEVLTGDVTDAIINRVTSVMSLEKDNHRQEREKAHGNNPNYK